MNSIETMNSFKSSGTIESTELNIDTYSFAGKIINFHRIKTHTNNAVYNEKVCLDEFDKVLSNFGNKYDSHNDDLNYDIFDLDNLEYITYKHKTNTNNNFDGSSDIKHFLYEHSYCMREQITPTFEETQTRDTKKKFTDCYKTGEKSFIDILYFNGVNYNVGELDESPQFCDTECNLQEQIVESVNFEMIPNYVSTDNISIYTISDEEMNNDFKAPDLDVISISSASSIEDRFDVGIENDSNSCGYHSSDFEFIEEHEAKRNGLIINYNPQKIKDKVKDIKIAKEYNSQFILDYFNMPTVNNNIEYKIPQDTNYIRMFERNIPYTVHCMENKSLYTNNCSMNAEYQDLGFNMILYDHEEVNKHIQEEANESAKKIIFMYPSENPRMRKKRRI